MQATITATEIEAMNQKQLLTHLVMTAKEAQAKFTDTKVSLTKQLREYALAQLAVQPEEVIEAVDQVSIAGIETTETVEEVIAEDDTHPIVQYLKRLADAGDAEAMQLLETRSTWLKGTKKLSQGRKESHLKEKTKVKSPKNRNKENGLVAAITLVEIAKNQGIEAAMTQLEKNVEYVKRTICAYEVLYLGSSTIANLFNSGKLSWSAIYKLACTNTKHTQAFIEVIERKALAQAS